MRGHKAFLAALAAFLLLMNIGAYLLRDITMPDGTTELAAPPREILDYTATDLKLTPQELAILAPAKVLNRKYQRPGSKSDWEVVWLNLLEANSIGTLHNFYDSLVASGAKPEILKTETLATKRGPLSASLIRYYNAAGQSFYLLLWYQCEDGTAANRWQWYRQILALRLRHRKAGWQLVEVATPIAPDALRQGRQEKDLNRLRNFAVALYEASGPKGRKQPD